MHEDIIKKHTKKVLKNQDFLMFMKNETGDERIELPPKVLETPIIPLDQSPRCSCRTRYLYHIKVLFVNPIFEKIINLWIGEEVSKLYFMNDMG